MKNLSTPPKFYSVKFVRVSHSLIQKFGRASPLFIILLSTLIPSITIATKPLDIVINEIAWMGSTVLGNDEWIELYNNTENSINLDGWQLVTQDGTPKINLSGTIPANGFYLLERTNDDTVPGISADKIYTGALGNNGENLKLYDNLNNIVDEVNCSEKWLAGDNAAKQTMERKTDNNWQTSQNSGGTPKTQNSIIVQIEPQPQDEPPESIVEVKPQQPIVQIEPQPQDEPPESIVEVKPQQPTQQPKIYPTDVVFNEILPSPEGADEKGEWIEIFNQNNFEVDLSDWQISDTVGKITTLTFPAGTKILPMDF